MSTKCFFCYDDGNYCKKWARTGSRFCGNHQPVAPEANASKLKIHPHVRLATEEDVFQLVRESVNAVRLGAMAPAQAYALGYLLNFWLKMYSRSTCWERERALRQQILPTLVDAEAAAEAERLEQATAEAEQQTAESERDIVHEAELALIVKHGPAIIPFLTGAPSTTESDQDPPSAPIAAASADASGAALSEISNLRFAIPFTAPPAPLSGDAPAAPAADYGTSVVNPASPIATSALSADAPSPAPFVPSQVSEFRSAIPSTPARRPASVPPSEISNLRSAIPLTPDSHPHASPSVPPSISLGNNPERQSTTRHGNSERHSTAGERANGSLDETLTRAILKQLFRPRRPNNTS